MAFFSLDIELMHWHILIYLIFNRWSLNASKWCETKIMIGPGSDKNALVQIFYSRTSVPTSHGGSVLLVGLLTLSPSRTTRPTSRFYGDHSQKWFQRRVWLLRQTITYWTDQIVYCLFFFYLFCHLFVIIPTHSQQYQFSLFSFRAPPWIPDNLRIMSQSTNLWRVLCNFDLKRKWRC